MVNITVNLWSHDLLQQWNTQINIPAVSETHNSVKDIIRYYTQWSPAIQAIQEHKATSKPFEVLTALPSEWLTEKPMAINRRNSAGFKTSGIGATRCSLYCRINKPL